MLIIQGERIVAVGPRNSISMLAGAHVNNLEKDLGTLEAGKIANVLIVKGDPLQDLKALSNVQYVIHNGEVIRKPGETTQ